MSKSFNDYNKRDNLMLVDGLNLAFRYKHANKKVFADEYVDTVVSLGTSYKAKDIAILGDGGSSWRKSIYPEYKGNRIALREKQTEEEAQAFQDFLEEVDRAFDILSAYGYNIFKYKGVEADDIAAMLCATLVDDYDHIWLISTDKDWDLLINDKVSRFSYKSRKEVSASTWDKFYDYDRDMHISIKVLMGDSGDNVPGVAGVGEKRAYNILREFGPTAFDVYDAIPIDRPQKFIKNLNEFKENILTNYMLMDLPTFYEENIGKENMQDILNKVNK